MLTSEQKAHYDTFGYLVLRQVLRPDEIATFLREATEILDEERGGRPFAGVKRDAIIPFFERGQFLAQLPADDRIYGIAESLLGPDFFLVATEGNLHVGDTLWHGGAGNPDVLPHVKIAFYLEPLTPATGCLRIIPGSHRPEFGGHLKEIHDLDDQDRLLFGVPQRDLPCVAVESEPGDLIAFTESVFHASFGGRPGRHQHAISFMANPRTEDEVAHLRDVHSRMKYSYHPAESYINSDSPRLRRMVEPMVELGFETSKV